MIEIYCPKCLDFTPLVFGEPYQWEGAVARNVICAQCQSAVSILKGDGMGAHVLQKIAELAYYAPPPSPAIGIATQSIPATKRPRKGTRRLKLVP